ncbi:hypothetical protein AB9R84_15690 (plasmid) [Oceanimonas smirnovii]|uniref:hypothetical protein n=1 Tax=Oceanimonas smirnovii TaxID=264574 RepID=UPI003AAA50D5
MLIKVTFAKVVLGITIILAGLFGYGVWVGVDHNTNGVSVFQAGITASSMNPVSREGYLMMIKQNSALMRNLNSLQEKY